MPRAIKWNEDDRERFKSLCAIMCTQAEIESIMRVSHDTLIKLIAENFPDTPTWQEAYDAYSADGKASLRRKQFELAMDGNITMLVWLGKQHLGQREPYKQIDAPAEQPAEHERSGGLGEFKSRHADLSVVRSAV